AAAVAARSIAVERAVDDRECAEVGNGASDVGIAAAARGIAVERTVGDRQCAAGVDVNAAAEVEAGNAAGGRIARDRTVGKRQCAATVNVNAAALDEISIRKYQLIEREQHAAAVDRESAEAGRAVALHRQHIGGEP